MTSKWGIVTIHGQRGCHVITMPWQAKEMSCYDIVKERHYNVNVIKLSLKQWLYNALRASTSWRLCPVSHVLCLLSPQHQSQCFMLPCICVRRRVSLCFLCVFWQQCYTSCYSGPAEHSRWHFNQSPIINFPKENVPFNKVHQQSSFYTLLFNFSVSLSGS